MVDRAYGSLSGPGPGLRPGPRARRPGRAGLGPAAVTHYDLNLNLPSPGPSQCPPAGKGIYYQRQPSLSDPGHRHRDGPGDSVRLPGRLGMMRDVKLGRGHQRSTGLGHKGSRHRRCANIHCSKYYLRSLQILPRPRPVTQSFTGFPDHDSILTVLVITRSTTSQTGPLHPATVTGRKAHNARESLSLAVLARKIIKTLIMMLLPGRRRGLAVDHDHDIIVVSRIKERSQLDLECARLESKMKD
jgi:hypothetical protein